MAAGLLEGFQDYRAALEKKRLDDDIVRRRWLLAKQAMWLLLLVGAFLIFYLIGIMQESMNLLMVRY